jgi:hypothetical protein
MSAGILYVIGTNGVGHLKVIHCTVSAVAMETLAAS